MAVQEDAPIFFERFLYSLKEDKVIERVEMKVYVRSGLKAHFETHAVIEFIK